MNLLEELKKENYTFLASNGYHSTFSGIRPVLNKVNENREFFKDLEVADKVIGKASAMLLALSKVKKVNCIVISKTALQVFEKYQIECDYEVLTDYIVNYANSGMCPMEEAVLNVDDLQKALEILNVEIKQFGTHFQKR